MADADRNGSGETFTIESPLDDREGMTLRAPTTGATLEVAEIADETAREYLKELESGSTVRLELTGAETPTIEGVLPVSMPDSYGTDHTFEIGGI
jgi:hypothetical protein